MSNQSNRIAIGAAVSGGGFPARVGQLWRRWRAAREHRRAMAYLLTRENRMLSDIGIDRATVLSHYLEPWTGVEQAQCRHPLR